MKVDVNKCLHCGGCVGSCPKNAIFLNDFVLEFNDDCVGSCPKNAIFLNDFVLEFNDDCIKCGICVKLCPVAALSLE